MKDEKDNLRIHRFCILLTLYLPVGTFIPDISRAIASVTPIPEHLSLLLTYLLFAYLLSMK